MGLAVLVLEFLAVYELAWRGSWWVAAAGFIAAMELRFLLPGSPALSEGRATAVWKSLPGLMMGLSVVVIVATVPRYATQVAVAVFYGAWLIWRERQPVKAPIRLVQLLLVQAVMFEAIFLVAAIWHLPSLAVVVLVWAGAYAGVYGALSIRKDSSAGVMAATWGVIAAEVAWVLQLWLITYTMKGGYVLVPQPALILTALAYIFGSILASSRQGSLSRRRLGEYMVIALVLVAIVVVGTSWHGDV